MIARLRAPLACALALSGLAPPGAAAFEHVAIGDPLRDRELVAAAGGKAPLLGTAEASVFVIFGPENEASYEALRELSFLERDFQAKPVRFVAVVSDADDLEAAKALVLRAGLRMPLLVDAGDALYGELGVRLHPVVGIANGRKQLVAYEHYRKIGFREIVRGRIRVALGEMAGSDMGRLLARPDAWTGDALTRARRHVALARRQLALGAPKSAEGSARKAIALSPRYASAHAVLARSLAAQGRCEDARAAVQRALAIAPGDPDAREGLRQCEGR